MTDFKARLATLEELETRTTTVSDEQQWRKSFEKIGPDLLRLELATSKQTFPDNYLRCAHEWMLDKEAEKAALETSRFRWTVVGAIAAIVAAVASVIPFFR